MAIEKNHVIKVLEETVSAVKNNKIVKLKKLSDQTIHSASIEQDIESITIAVIIYSLSKIIERSHYEEYSKSKPVLKSLTAHLSYAAQALRKTNESKFKQELKSARTEVTRLSGKTKKYIQDVFKKARINKASKIYEHGISMETTAKLLGISIWELAEYAGQRHLKDPNLYITLPIEKRIKFAMSLFK